ncbi:MAG: O-antigen ligase family protein [Candidatus Marinimicrobia bacterium]|nr:O-antigen ligase family protein [Candidatus Neomarinimicrobiota bacterium]
MLYILLAFIIIAAFFIIMQWTELGFALVIIIPLVKDIFQLPEEQIPLLNLLFLFVLFTIISFLYKYSFKLKDIKLNREHLGLFIIFSSILLFSLNYSNELKYGADKILKFIFFAGFFFLSSMAIFQSKRKVDNFVNFLRYSILAISIINLILLVRHLTSQGFFAVIVRFTMVEGNSSPITMARVSGLGVLLWFLSTLESESLKQKLWSIVAIIPIALTLIATNTRGPLLIVFVMIIVYLFFYLDVSINKKLLALGLIFFIIVTLALVLPESVFLRFILLFRKSNLNTNQSLVNASSAARRLIFFRRLFQYLATHPWQIFLGTGAGSFFHLFKDYQLAHYPHNIFLEILFEQGILGLSIFIVSLLVLLRDFNKFIFQNKQLQTWVLPLVMGFIYYFLNAQISGDIDNNRFIWFFWGALIGVIIPIASKKAEKSKFLTTK